jgi:hypothetical protein
MVACYGHSSLVAVRMWDEERGYSKEDLKPVEVIYIVFLENKGQLNLSQLIYEPDLLCNLE